MLPIGQALWLKELQATRRSAAAGPGVLQPRSGPEQVKEANASHSRASRLGVATSDSLAGVCEPASGRPEMVAPLHHRAQRRRSPQATRRMRRAPIQNVGNTEGMYDELGKNIWSGLLLRIRLRSATAAHQRLAQQPQKPNILVIMADDIGYWNISAYNRGMMGYRTPNIDRIANEGAIFTDYYGQQSCTAGRAAFITGQSPLRTGLLKVGLPAAKEGLSEKDPTIAELLKPQGYATGQFGKNHLGDRNEFLPTVHGFDEFFGNLYHLNAEDEPENPDYPKNPSFKAQFGPRGVMKCVATPTDTPGDDPRFGTWGKQKCEDTGPLTKKRMETIDEEFLERLDGLHRSRKSRQEAVLRLVQSEPHAHLDPAQSRIPGQNRSWHLSRRHGGA